MPFLVEHSLTDHWHACTVDDVATVLNLLPKRHVNNFSDIAGIQGIVLRQHTRKEMLLSSTWGRLAYYTAVDRHIGPVIFLNR